MASIDILANYIRAHGFTAHCCNGMIEARMIAIDANGQVVEEWGCMQPTWASVRQWLGY